VQRERERNYPDERIELEWHLYARCADLWLAEADRLLFPWRGDRRSGAGARAICAGCDVREECLEFALGDTDAYHHGIWGGTTHRERQRIRGAMKRAGSSPNGFSTL
jgi:WhiB family transcriptional regulator, redox-sensing transcriptional regulator